MLKNHYLFSFHRRCQKLNIIPILFADDMLLFGKGHVSYVRVLYHKFSNASSLRASCGKRNIYFAKVSEKVRSCVL